MQNDRPIDDPRMNAALQAIAELMRHEDLTGAVVLVNEHESCFHYQLSSTWNAVVDDPMTPLGFRIRAKSAELGHDRAHQLIEGAAWTVGALLDFGVQTRQWAQDLFKLMRQAWLKITHRPFGGGKIPHLGGINMAKRGYWGP